MIQIRKIPGSAKEAFPLSEQRPSNSVDLFGRPITWLEDMMRPMSAKRVVTLVAPADFYPLGGMRARKTNQMPADREWARSVQNNAQIDTHTYGGES